MKFLIFSQLPWKSHDFSFFPQTEMKSAGALVDFDIMSSAKFQNKYFLDLDCRLDYILSIFSSWMN